MPLRLLPAGSRDNLCLTAIQGLVNYKGLPVLNGSLSLHSLPPAIKNAVDKTRKVI